MAPISKDGVASDPVKSRILLNIKCVKCNKTVRNGIRCDKCDLWNHFKCVNIDERNLPDENSEWCCPYCIGDVDHDGDSLIAIVQSLNEENQQLIEEIKRLKECCEQSDKELCKLFKSRVSQENGNGPINDPNATWNNVPKDLSVGLISVLTDIVWRATVAWYAGNAACKIIKFLQATVTYSSTYVLVALSIDRYDAITHPMNFSGSWRRARLLVASAWFLSVVFSIPIIVMYREEEVQGAVQCWLDFPEQWHWQLYVTIVAVTIFVIPALIITACYTVIVYTIWSKSKLLTPSSRKVRHMKNGDHVSVDDQDSRRASSRGLIPKAKIKTVKMTFVIVFVFILCWSPYIVFDLLQVFGYFSKTQTAIAVASFIQSLAPLNSAANPLIYCLFSTHICRSLRKIPPFAWLSCCWPNEVRMTDHSGRCLRYTHANTDSSSVTDTFTSTSARRMNTLHSSSVPSIRHVQLRLPTTTNSAVHNVQTTSSIL